VSDTFENQNNLLLGFLMGFKHTLKVLELKMKKEGLGVRNMELDAIEICKNSNSKINVNLDL